jgi:Polyketide cyclase / dehydrase and lipid transport
MKVALILAGLLVTLILLIVGIGALLPQKHVVSRTAAFKAPAQRVFQLISAPQTWRTDLRESAAVEDRSSRQLFRETSTSGEPITYEVLESRPPTLRKVRIADKNLPYGGTWTYQILPQDGGCRLTITEDGEVYNALFRFVSQFILGHTRTIDAHLKMLAKALGEDLKLQD